MHLGNARTALFNALLARRDGGSFLLRLEDTDPARCREEYVPGISADLQWLGIAPDPGAEAGPVRQSQRGGIYTEQLARLEADGRAYPCFCSREELARVRGEQLAAGRPPRYPGTCARLSAAEARRRLDAGERAALRFRVAQPAAVEFDDLVRGLQRFDAAAIGDFVVRRADHTPAFVFSNAVDDALMGISHVLRGEDHLSNTPRQLMVLAALGLAVPRYGHVSMVVDDDGAPLSKRSRGAALAELRARGWLAAALVNQLARLGHPSAGEAVLDVPGLAAAFDPGRISASPVRFDPAQLRHWQRLALAAAPPAELWQWMGAEVQALVPARQREAFVAAVRDNVLRPRDALAWARVVYLDALEPEPAACEVIRAAGGDFFRRALEVLGGDAGGFAALAPGLESATGARGRALYRPLRAALTGRLEGPELAALYALMDPARVRRRLQAAARAA